MENHEPFTGSAFVAHLQSPASEKEVEAELIQLLHLQGLEDPELVDELLQSPVTVFGLGHLRRWNATLASHVDRDVYGKAYAKFGAPTAILKAVVSPQTLNPEARLPEGLARVMHEGAEGLLKLGFTQFAGLAKLTREVADWIEKRAFRSVALVESPIGNSLPVQVLQTLLEKRDVIATPLLLTAPRATVLITGESGTGKELIARAIHRRSRRSRSVFTRMNCAVTPPSLMAAELFGYEKGAFTGANQRHAGRFEVANHGTIFLDEIGEMPGETQVALLRVLQEREFERVGGTQSIPVDVRVIAATNCDLPSAVRSGKFRLDLFYRLNVFPIHVPPLRERPEDILLLAKYFIERYAAKEGKRIRRVEKRTAELLEGYHWPGNIRELQNVIERAMILCDSDTFFVEEAWLQPEAEPRVGLQPSLINQERELIEAALAETRGRISGPDGAARRLGVPRTTLESKIKSLRIDKYRYRVEAREL